MPVHREAHPDHTGDAIGYRPQFARPGEVAKVPRYRVPDGSMRPETAYQIVHDELMLDGNARLNVATFVTTWMEPAANALIAECADKNMIDKDEYPQTAELELRCVNMLADLWGSAGAAGQATGCSTTGERGLHAGRDGAQVALARPSPGRRAGQRGAQPGHGHQRAGLLGQVLPLLGGRAPLGAGGRRRDPPHRRPGGGRVRREHHRSGGHPRLRVRRQL